MYGIAFYSSIITDYYWKGTVFRKIINRFDNVFMSYFYAVETYLIVLQMYKCLPYNATYNRQCGKNACG